MTKWAKAVFFGGLVFLCSVEAKVLIFTYAYNRPEFIETQYKTFKKFLLDEYEYVVFNDAIEPVLKKKIELMCEKLQIRCILIPQEIHDRPYLKRHPLERFHEFPPVH